MLSFQRDDDEGRFQVVLGEISTVWPVEVCEQTDSGWRLSGLTKDTQSVWGDTFWFELHTGESTRIEYRLQQLVRTDLAQD